MTFVEMTREAGINFKHEICATGQKFYVETMGAGCGFVDYDNDGFLDIYAVNGSGLPGCTLAEPALDRLYHNNGDGTFTDVTEKSGIRETNYGQGVVAADYDNDGDQDIYVVNFGPNVLYRNNGDGTFTDVTAKAGVGDKRWGIHGAFADFNGDGLLDLFVVNYLKFTVDNNTWCGREISGIRAYCHPDVFEGEPNILYRNQGDGTFRDITRESGLDKVGKGMGVAVFDSDNDGDLDIYVTNDAIANYLFRNKGDGTFEDVGLMAGCALTEDGKEQSSMGVDFGDIDNDGDFDLTMCSLDYEYNAMYQNNGDHTFTDVSYSSGFGEPSIMFVGYAPAFFDFDNDGDLDVLVGNGHVIDNIDQINDSMEWEQRNFLFEGDGAGHFKEVGLQHGEYFSKKRARRGLAAGDVDNDGDIDFIANNMARELELVRNDGGNRGAWIGFKLVGTRSNRDAIGSMLTLTAGGKRQVRQVHTGCSYESQSDMRQFFGLGTNEGIEQLEVRWPTGVKQVFQGLNARRYYVLTEGSDEAKAIEPMRGFERAPAARGAEPSRPR